LSLACENYLLRRGAAPRLASRFTGCAPGLSDGIGSFNGTGWRRVERFGMPSMMRPSAEKLKKVVEIDRFMSGGF
jgi:hypothetical protein